MATKKKRAGRSTKAVKSLKSRKQSTSKVVGGFDIQDLLSRYNQPETTKTVDPSLSPEARARLR